MCVLCVYIYKYIRKDEDKVKKQGVEQCTGEENEEYNKIRMHK